MSRASLLTPVLCLILLLLSLNAGAETVAGLPLHIQKFDSEVIRVWIGDHISSTATMAFATEKGLVIIDTTGNPEIDRQLRQVIARELGRDDFKILINTHEHMDHTGGNAVYADCTIVGHELVEAGMIRAAGDRDRIVEWRTARASELEAEIAQLSVDDPQIARLKEQLILNRLNLEVEMAAEPLLPPTKTFADRLDLDLGDTHFELYYIGGMHSASDIAIFVPEHGLLMTGDTMADVWLTDTPGCLASFIARPGVQHDFPLLLANWDTLLAKKEGIKTLVPAHWNGELTYAGFEARVKYVEELWAGANQANEEGTSLETLLTQYSLATRFPDLVESPGCNGSNNFTTIGEMWATVSDQKSGARALYELIESEAGEEEIRSLLAQREAQHPTHFFLETEINAYGYRFLQAGLVDQATTVFLVNVDFYPESWNVYDSLGEALYTAGKNEKAIAMYKKSLELNPESPTGIQMLERIRSGVDVN